MGSVHSVVFLHGAQIRLFGPAGLKTLSHFKQAFSSNLLSFVVALTGQRPHETTIKELLKILFEWVAGRIPQISQVR